ncbi:hypothetical protein ABEB36_015092 [Hypothenemus hampei]|uniref:Transcription factor Adf-1 n=1 Tax=Hypothenemus hampei TaxID=57062 RepID=A0ABD1E347_HYPHA
MSDDPTYNTKFVEIIEQYPCIYDYTRADHSKREVLEKAWTAIANEMKESTGFCKEKWKNLRTAFRRSLKKPPSGSASNLGPINDESQICEDEASTISVNSDDDLLQRYDSSLDKSRKRHCNDSSAPSTTASSSSTSFTNETCVSQRPTKLNKVDQCLIDYITTKKTSMPQSSNPDYDFLKSLLPDLAKMNDYQKRLFKKRTLDIIDSILCDGIPQLTQSTVPVPIPSPDLFNYSFASSSHSSACSK